MLSGKSGIVIPDLRDECRDFLDFIKIEKEQVSGKTCWQNLYGK